MNISDVPPTLLARMEGPVPPPEFVCNGITFAPDFVGGVDCRAAGIWHDYAYGIGGTESDRERADYQLFRNLRTSDLPHRLAQIEFRRVRVWGIPHFRYDDPPRGWRRVWLYVRCFFRRYARFEE